MAVKELCRRHGFSEASYNLWRSKFGGMNMSDAKRLRELEIETMRLKKLLAKSLLENEVMKEALRKKCESLRLRRHLPAIILGNDGVDYEQQALHGRVHGRSSQADHREGAFGGRWGRTAGDFDPQLVCLAEAA